VQGPPTAPTCLVSCEDWTDVRQPIRLVRRVKQKVATAYKYGAIRTKRIDTPKIRLVTAIIEPSSRRAITHHRLDHAYCTR
jgi:hypothetical protein